jgi:hypothetical protein
MAGATMPSAASTAKLRERYEREMPHPTGMSAEGIRPVVPAPTLLTGNEIDVATILNDAVKTEWSAAASAAAIANDDEDEARRHKDSSPGVYTSASSLLQSSKMTRVLTSTTPKTLGEMARNSAFVRDLLEPATPGGVVALKVNSLPHWTPPTH